MAFRLNKIDFYFKPPALFVVLAHTRAPRRRRLTHSHDETLSTLLPRLDPTTNMVKLGNKGFQKFISSNLCTYMKTLL